MNRTSITSNQEKQYRRFVEDATRHGAELALKKVPLDKDGLQKLFGRGGEFNTAIAEVIVAKTRELSGLSPYLALVADWEKFYRDLGVAVDLSNLAVPKKQEGFDRLIVVAKGMTSQGAYNLCEKLFRCWKYTDESLDEVIIHEDRAAKNKSYAVWVRDRVEADEELAGKSFNDLANLKIPGITLTEREILEAKYFKETGKHLDISNWTLCSGSRNSDGGVPYAYWDGIGREFCVYWAFPAFACGLLRSRQVVS